MSETVFVIVLSVTALGYSASIVPDQQRFRAAYSSEADCRKDIAAVRRAISIPSIATLNGVECRKLDLKK